MLVILREYSKSDAFLHFSLFSGPPTNFHSPFTRVRGRMVSLKLQKRYDHVLKFCFVSTRWWNWPRWGTGVLCFAVESTQGHPKLPVIYSAPKDASRPT